MYADLVGLIIDYIVKIAKVCFYDWLMLGITSINAIAFIILSYYIYKLNKNTANKQEDLQKRNLKLQLYDKRVVVYYNLVNTYLKLARKTEEKKYDDTENGIILMKFDQIELIFYEFLNEVYIEELQSKHRMLFEHELISQSIFKENICKDIKIAEELLKKIIDKLSQMNKYFSCPEGVCDDYKMYKIHVDNLINSNNDNRLIYYNAYFFNDKFMNLYFEFYDLREEYLTHLNKSLLSEIMKCINISNIDI